MVRSLVESTKAFVRWMDGTCIETPEQAGLHDEDEPVLFTFYWDVAANPQVGCLVRSSACSISSCLFHNIWLHFCSVTGRGSG
jgi:hypothetical protein